MSAEPALPNAFNCTFYSYRIFCFTVVVRYNFGKYYKNCICLKISNSYFWLMVQNNVYSLVLIFSGKIFVCCVFPLIHNVALCCNCMMTVLPLWHSLILKGSRCIYSVMQMFSKRNASATVHPLCLFGKIDHFCKYILNLLTCSFSKTVDLSLM